jgi:filamentous hemagglutinin family protein
VFSQSLFHQWWQLSLASLLALVGAIAGGNNCALAEIVRDNTLGNESSVITRFPNFDQIDGGAMRGANLFHSFEQFNIDARKQANFTNPSGIKNIISRVTGGSRSEILGTLRVLGAANLFLINPNGIIFGRDAKLALGGSFVGTTANAIGFGDQGFFNASAPDSPALLVVNPSALLFNQIASQPITYQSTGGLGISTNQSLLLVGGNVNLEGGQMVAPASRIELGGLAGAGTVGLNIEGKNLRLSFPQNAQLADISLTNGATIDVSASHGSSGNIQVQGRRVTLANSSKIVTDTLGSEPAGTLTVRASELVEVLGGSRLLAESRNTGTGGNLTIETGKLIIRDGAEVAAGAFNSGSGGTVTVRASDSVEISGTSTNGKNFSSILTQTDGAGNAGLVSIETGRLIVQGGARVSTSTANTSSGQGGTLVIKASDSVQLGTTSAEDPQPSGLFTSAYGSGKAGDLTIETRQLIIRGGARASALTAGSLESAQLGGKLSVKASESVQLIGTSPNGLNSGLFAGTTSGSIGSAGELTIETQKLQVLDGALVSAGTAGEGRGGSLIVRASTSVELMGTSTNGQPSLLSTRTTGVGDAGNNLMITTGQLTVKDGAQISSSSTGLGSAGDVQVQTDSLRLDQGQIISQATSGNGGNITLSIKDLLLLRRGSEISTTAGTAQQGGDGGNITINAPLSFIVAVKNENSDIIANAFSGSGGRITINATGIFGIWPLSRQDLQRLSRDLDPRQLPTNDITAISQTNPSLSGTIELITPDIDPNRGLVELPTNLVDASQQIATGCTPRGRQANSFVATGRSGLPLSPTEPLRSSAVITQWVTSEQTQSQGNEKVRLTSLSKHPDNQQSTLEANGWVVDKEGNVYLVALPDQAPDFTAQMSVACHRS